MHNSKVRNIANEHRKNIN